jgi:hypothetical protein
VLLLREELNSTIVLKTILQQEVAAASGDRLRKDI